jgi:hypothetical protein
MQNDPHIRALRAIAQIRQHLQAAYQAARELEAAVPPKPLDRLSDHIGSVSAAADWIREEVEARAKKKSAAIQAPLAA